MSYAAATNFKILLLLQYGELEALKDFFHLLPNFFCIFDMFFWLLANPITFSLLIYFIEDPIINILLLTFDFLLLQIPIQ